MIKYILCTGMYLFCWSYSHSQSALFNTDAADVSERLSVEPSYNLPSRSDGKVEGVHSERGIRYSAHFRNYLLHGNWISWYDNNVKHDEGQLKKGIPDGTWKLWYPNGQLRSIRNYSWDKYKRVTQQWKTANPRQVNYKLTDIYLQDRNKATSFIRSEYAFQSLEDYSPVFKSGLLHGLYINYFEDGSVKDSGFYKNGLREGIWVEKPNPSSYWIGTYKNAERTGTWKLFSSNKQLLEMVVYKNGKEDWRKVF